MNLRTAEEVSILRENIEHYTSARSIADGIIASAEPWAARSEEQLRSLIPPAQVPRASYVHLEGCPLHGREAHWQHAPFREPWRVTCSVGGESYPSNDFSAFLASGMRDRSLLVGPYADDGYGWRKACPEHGRRKGEPHKYWFIGYCCRSLLSTALNGLTVLSQAYVLTGEIRYARKAAVLLKRIGEVYPDMAYPEQGRYALEFSPHYTGKIFNLIHETRTVAHLAEAYDCIRDVLPDPDLRIHVERNVVLEGMNAILEGDVRGNYGMHQLGLLTAAVVLGDREKIDQAIAWVLNHTGEAVKMKEMNFIYNGYIFRDKSAHAEGLNFALDNLIFREGIGWESSPSYCFSWVRPLFDLAALLEKLGVDVYPNSKFRRMLHYPLEMDCIGKFTPAIGDCGSTTGGRIELSADLIRTGWEKYGGPRFARMLLDREIFGERTFRSYEDLFRKPLERSDVEKAAEAFTPSPPRSTNMGGYGLGILRFLRPCSGQAGEDEEQAALSLYYGRAATEHGHYDRLSLELYAYGRKMIPDLGYPEHASEGKKPALWTKNTVSHTTVVVDERRQDLQSRGEVRAFVATPRVQFIDASAPETYYATSVYRRTTALIQLGPDARYVFDLFRVAGGGKHDYSIHGFDGTFSTEGIALSAPARKGTLAGENVAFGEIYDDMALRWATPHRSFYKYHGSGYSYLYDVQRGRPDAPWSALYKDRNDPVGLKLTFLPRDTKEVVVATGEPPQKGDNPRTLKYILLRNPKSEIRNLKSPMSGALTSVFTTIMEPFRDTPKIRSVTSIASDFRTSALRIAHREGTDYIIHTIYRTGEENPEPCKIEGVSCKAIPSRFALSTGCFGFVRLDRKEKVVELTLIGRGELRAAGHSVRIERPLRGQVADIHYEDGTVEVTLDEDSQPLAANGMLSGETIVFGHDRHTTSYTVEKVSPCGKVYRIVLRDGELRIGKFVVTGIDPEGRYLTTPTCLYLADQGTYRGTRLVDEHGKCSMEIEDVQLAPHWEHVRRAGRIKLRDRAALSEHFRIHGMGTIYDFGPGDRFEIVPHLSLTRKTDGRFETKGNGEGEIEGV